MRTLRSGYIPFLLAGLTTFILAPAAIAEDAGSSQGYYTQAQNDYHQALRRLSDAFQAEYPEYLDMSDDPQVLDRRAELARIWTDRVRALQAEYGGTEQATSAAAWPRATGADPAEVLANPPNELASFAPAPEEQINASFSYHELRPAEAYGVWTRYFAPFGLPPTQVWYGGTPLAGSDGPWMATGAINALLMPFVLPEAWNPSIAAIPPVGVDQYYVAMSEWAAPALVLGAPSAIVAYTSTGGGAGIPSGTGPSVVFQGGPTNWVDYPYLVVDDVVGNPGPPGFGDVHIAWVEYIEGGDGDADGNGIFYDDPADGFVIWAATANTGLGPSPYPGFFLWTIHPRPAVMPQGHQAHRPSLSVVGPTGTLPPLSFPPSAIFLAYVDFLSSSVIVDANPAPGLGAGWAFGPLAVAPVVLLPPVLNGGVKAASTVSIAVDNGPLFPGQVYIAWADHSLGDADIFFSLSSSGGGIYTPPIRINQDLPGNGADQWAPHMTVDPGRGTICVTYYDRRMDPANVLVETWTSSSTDGGLTWSDSLVSDPGPTQPVTALNVGGWRYVGDYLTSDWNPVSGWGGIWNDGRNGNDQDVYFENLKQTSPDSDGDGIPDVSDNCPAVANPNQAITIAVTGDVAPPGDGVLTAADIIYLVNYVFKSGPIPNPCPAAADVNCDGAITAADVIFLVNHVFKGGPAPCNVCLAFGLGWSCP